MLPRRGEPQHRLIRQTLFSLGLHGGGLLRDPRVLPVTSRRWYGSRTRDVQILSLVLYLLS